MNLFEIFKKSFSTVITNPAVTLFLVLFMIASNFLASYAFHINSYFVTLTLTGCIFLLSLCFISGWFEITKDLTLNKPEENKDYGGIFLEGIGKNIIPIGLGCFIYVLILMCVLILTGKICHEVFGSLDFIAKDASILTQDNASLIKYFETLTDNQKYILSAWQLSFIFSTMVFGFIMLFYYPAIIFEKTNNNFLKPLIALKDALIFTFKNFFGALFIHIFIYIIYMLFGIIRVNLGNNIIISILLIFFQIYFISFVVMLIFNYYEQRNNNSKRTDCIGENANIDKSCEEN